MTKCSNLTVLHVAVQFSQALFLKTLSFLHCVFLPPCHRLIDHGYVSFPGVGNSNPLQYSCLETSMARGAWWAIVHEIENTTEGLSTHMWVYFWVLYCVSLVYVSIFHFPHAILFWLALKYSLKSGKMMSPALFFFSGDCFGNSMSFVVPYEL